MLLPALGNLGFENSTFADFDFAVWGHHYRECVHQFGQITIYLICLALLVALLAPSASVTSGGGQHAQL